MRRPLNSVAMETGTNRSVGRLGRKGHPFAKAKLAMMITRRYDGGRKPINGFDLTMISPVRSTRRRITGSGKPSARPRSCGNGKGMLRSGLVTKSNGDRQEPQAKGSVRRRFECTPPCGWSPAWRGSAGRH